MEDAMSGRPPIATIPNDRRAEDALDAALAASFPASDPVAALTPAGERSPSAVRPPFARGPSRLRRPQKKDARP